MTFASTLDWGAVYGNVSDKNIFINDALVMDTQLVFYNCKFTFGPNAVIRTSQGNYFGAVYSKFFCCNGMWKGIEVINGGGVLLWGCEIEDARKVLQVDDDALPVFSLGTTFNRNHIGIANGSFQAGGDGTLNFGYFLGNTFESTSQTNWPYDGPPGTNWPFAHISLDRCAASLISFAGSENVFRDSYYGIYLQDADLTVQHAKFEDIQFIGIYTEWGDDYTGSHVKVQDCTFQNGTIESAVFAVRSDVEVASSHIEGRYVYGIYATDNTSSEEIKINDNTFKYAHSPINWEVFAERPVASGSQGKHLEINGNTFTIDGQAPALNLYETIPILLYSLQNAHVSDQAEIMDNTFTFNTPNEFGEPQGVIVAAIDVETPAAFDNTKVSGNTITVDDALMNYGIFFNDQFGAGNEISHNTIDDELEVTGGDINTFYGISVLNATSGVTMCDNTVDGTRWGIHFVADNGMSGFRNNNFGKHETGLFIQNYNDGSTFVAGSIGDQIGHGNTWLTTAGSYSDKAGRCQGNVLDSEFIIENAFSSPSAQFPATSLLSPSSNWFKNSNVASDWCAPTPPPIPGPRLSDKDLETASGTGSIATANAVSRWEARRLLLDKLLRYPALLGENQTVSQFYNTWLNTSAGQFASVENQIRAAYAIQPADQTAMDDIQAERRNLRQQLAALENSAGVPADPFDYDPAKVAAKEAILAQLFDLHTEETGVKVQIRQQQQTALQVALAANDQLPATTPYESNRRLFNRLGIRLFLEGTLDQSEEAQLYALTASGQTDGGLAVEDANILLPLCDGSSTSPREQKRRRPSKVVTQTEEALILIAPNPAAEICTVTINTMEAGRLTLTDATGKTWLEQRLPEGTRQVEIQTDKIPAGLCIVSFLPDSGLPVSHKLVVQH